MGPELPIVAFISFLLTLYPFPWHWKARNVCVISVIFWLAIYNMNRGIDTIIWADNVTVRYRAWCHIGNVLGLSSLFLLNNPYVVVKFNMGAHFGLPASAMTPKPHEKCRDLWFEVGLCVVLPLVFTALSVIVESRRFGIVEGYGCTPWSYRTTLTLFIMYFPIISLSLIGLIYSGIALRWLIHRRIQFQQASQDSQPIPFSGRYLRLAALAVVQMTFMTVMTVSIMVQVRQMGIHPWTSWADVHKGWLEIPLVHKDSRSEFFWTLWKIHWYFPPVNSVVFFGYFGFDDRVTAEYKAIFTWIKTHTPSVKPKVVPVLPLSASDATHSDDPVGSTNNPILATSPETEETEGNRSDPVSIANSPTPGIHVQETSIQKPTQP